MLSGHRGNVGLPVSSALADSGGHCDKILSGHTRVVRAQNLLIFENITEISVLSSKLWDSFITLSSRLKRKAKGTTNLLGGATNSIGDLSCR